MKYIDVHSHLTEARFKSERDAILKQMKREEISTISIGTDRATSEQAVSLARENDNVWATIGQHPVDKKEEVFDASFYKRLYEYNQDIIVGLGECGLDYYWPGKDVESGKMNATELSLEKERQQKLFRDQINLAVELDLPLMLHVRSFKSGDAHRETLDILGEKEQELGKPLHVNFHFFTETPDIAREIVKRGYYVSFPGVITFANLDTTVASVPLDRIMTETDSPYAAPVPHRGKLATPLMIREMVKKIAQVHKVDEETVRKQVIENAHQLFRI